MYGGDGLVTPTASLKVDTDGDEIDDGSGANLRFCDTR